MALSDLIGKIYRKYVRNVLSGLDLPVFAVMDDLLDKTIALFPHEIQLGVDGVFHIS